MKNIVIVILIIVTVLFLTSSREELQETHSDPVDHPKKTYMDTPANTYETRVEAQNIANTIQTPSNSYLNSRVNARGLAKESVNQGNKRMEEQDKAMEAFLTK